MRLALAVIVVSAIAAVPAVAALVGVVPLRVERALVRATRVYDYLPTSRALGGYRYRNFTASSRGISVWFGTGGRELGFHVFAQQVPCRSGPGTEKGGPMRTISIAGLTVYWRGTSEDHEAWRCARGKGGRLVALEATDSFFGQQKLSQQTLPRIVASARSLG